MSERFETTVELGGKTATGLPVPDDVLERLGSGRKPAVVVTIGAHTYRSTVGQRGGRNLVPLSAEHRTAAGVAAGDTVTVELALDTAERTVDVPADLDAALAAAPGARAAFDALSYSKQRERALAVDGAKKAETRTARIAKIVAELSA